MTDTLLDPRQIAARLGLIARDGRFDKAALFAHLRSLKAPEKIA